LPGEVEKATASLTSGASQTAGAAALRYGVEPFED
jgi:hypothetical protein